MVLSSFGYWLIFEFVKMNGKKFPSNDDLASFNEDQEVGSSDIKFSIDQLIFLCKVILNGEALDKFGGVSGIEKLLHTNVEVGLSGDEEDIAARRLYYGRNEVHFFLN